LVGGDPAEGTEQMLGVVTASCTSIPARTLLSCRTGKKRFKSGALQHAYGQFVGDDPKQREEFEQQYEDTLIQMDAAQLIYDMRTKAHRSQRELARRVGTPASAINRLERADYDGHTLAMVRRIAEALNRRLELRAVPAKARKAKRNVA
jgi:ribosome-binding protein aMBF1 (putative translation factor)